MGRKAKECFFFDGVAALIHYQRCREVALSKRAFFPTVSALLLLLTGLFSTGSAFAYGEIFLGTFSGYVDEFPGINDSAPNEKGTCEDCHTNPASDWNKTSLKVTGPTSIASSQSTINLGVTGLSSSRHSYHWRYRVKSLGGVSNVSNSMSASSVVVGTSGNPTIEFCIVEAVTQSQAGIRNLHCGEFPITRAAPPDNAPVITTVSPSGTANLISGESQNVTVSAMDDGPSSELRHTAVSSNTAVATVTGNGFGSSRPFSIVAVGPGTATITFTVKDNGGGAGSKSDTESVNVVVSAPPNQAPNISSISPNGTVNLSLGGSSSITISATDDGPASALRYSGTSSNESVATVTGSGSGSSATLTVNAVAAGTATITFTVKDLNGGGGSKSDTETLTVVVAPAANQAPNISSVSPSGTINLTAGGTSSVTVSATDDGSATALRYSGSSSNGSIATVTGSGSGNSATLTVNAISAGTATITFTVKDKSGGSGSLSDTETITVVVAAPENQAPVVSSVSTGSGIALTVGDTRSIVVSATDDGPASQLRYTGVSSNTSVATISGSGSGNSATFSVNAVAAGSAILTITVKDENGGSGSKSVTEQVTVNVAVGNQAPQITALNPGSPLNLVTTGGGQTVTVTVSDENNASLTFSSQGGNSSVVTVSGGAGGSFQFTPQGVGETTVTLKVEDNGGLTDMESILVRVSEPAPTNTPPQISATAPAGTSSMIVGNSLSVTVTATDDSTNPLDYSASTANGSVATVSGGGSSGTFTVQGVAPGSTTITFVVTDASNETDSSTLAIVVNPIPPVNQRPEIISVSPSSSINLTTDSTEVVSIGVQDENPATLIYSGSSQNEVVATVSGGANGTFTITAQGTGSAEITLVATDEGGLEDSTTVSVSVVAANAAPQATDDQFVFDYQSTSALLNVLLNDSDPEGSALNIVLTFGESNLGGDVEVQGTDVLYTPPAGLVDSDSFTYTVTDAAGLESASATVTIIPSDQDGDQVVDNADNCLILANPNQLDMDSDMIGDLCDPDPDGDGAIGELVRPFTTGKFLVEGVCLDCHREGVSGAPKFGDEAAWAARVEQAGGIEPLLNSVTNGKGAMPAWGRVYPARELIQGLLYMTGLEEFDGEEGIPLFDADLDGIDNLNDNCVYYQNFDQADTDGDSVGDACESDVDGDGVLDYSVTLLVSQARGAGPQAGALVEVSGGDVTITARTRADLEGLTYDWSASSTELLAMVSGDTSGQAITLSPSQAGLFDAVVSVAGNGIVATSRTRVVITTATANLDLTDTDGDGYPAHLDNNNLNSNRILADNQATGNTSVFYSDGTISLGQLALYTAAENNFSSAGAMLSEAELLSAATARYPDVQSVTNPVVDSSIGIIDLELRELDSSTGTLVVRLSGNIPVSAVFKLYDPTNGSWRDFAVAGLDSIASAPTASADCPASASNNYSSGLNAGQGCVRLTLADGRANDIDQSRDGVISLVGAVGSESSTDPDDNEPEVIIIDQAKGGGGSVGPDLMLLFWVFGALWLRYQSIRRTAVVQSRRG